jgi:hypothetical protein
MNRRVFIKTGIGVVATFMFGASILKSKKAISAPLSNTISINDPWCNTNSDPLADMQRAIKDIRANSGLYPDFLVYEGEFKQLFNKYNT